jgi:hypothetical protein
VCVYSCVSPRSCTGRVSQRVTERAALPTLTLQPASRSAAFAPWTPHASTACRAQITRPTPPRPRLCPQRTSRQLQTGTVLGPRRSAGLAHCLQAFQPRSPQQQQRRARTSRSRVLPAAAAAGKPLRCRHARGAHTSVAAGPAARMRCRRGAWVDVVLRTAHEG